MTKNLPKKYYNKYAMLPNLIDINAEAIYEICKNKISLLKKTLDTILKDIK